MDQTTYIKPENVIRQCKYLASRGEHLNKTTWLIMWSYNRSIYFSELRDYCQFHQEIKNFLETNYEDNKMLIERIKQLPTIEYKDYSEHAGWKTFIFIILVYLFFPIAYVWLYGGIKYVNSTRQKIYHANGLYASISFLLKAEVN